MIRIHIVVVILALIVLAWGGDVAGAESEEHVVLETPEIGIEERLGSYVPQDLGFLDAGGDSVYLRDLVDRPTIITLVYYHCPTICKPLLSGVVEVVDKSDLEPGIDYRIVTISFDDTDTPNSAKAIRTNFFGSLEKNPSPDAWKFLTADSVTIARFTESVGFGFRRQEKDFAHGTSLIRWYRRGSAP